MPAKHDTVRQNLSLPAPLVEGLKVVATQRGETLSALVAEAIQRLLDGGASQTLLESLHQRLDHHEARQRAVEATLATVVAGLVEVQDLLRTQGKDHARLVDAANCLYDYVDGRQGKALPVGSVLKQFFGARR